MACDGRLDSRAMTGLPLRRSLSPGRSLPLYSGLRLVRLPSADDSPRMPRRPYRLASSVNSLPMILARSIPSCPLVPR